MGGACFFFNRPLAKSLAPSPSTPLDVAQRRRARPSTSPSGLTSSQYSALLQARKTCLPPQTGRTSPVSRNSRSSPTAAAGVESRPCTAGMAAQRKRLGVVLGEQMILARTQKTHQTEWQGTDKTFVVLVTLRPREIVRCECTKQKTRQCGKLVVATILDAPRGGLGIEVCIAD